VARFSPSYRGLGELLRSEAMEAEMVRRAEKVKARFEATAPVDETGPHPGRLRDSARVESSRAGGLKHDRAVATVVVEAPEAFYAEFGNRNVPRHRTLGRALDAARD
jgi:hypothetical protein